MIVIDFDVFFNINLLNFLQFLNFYIHNCHLDETFFASTPFSLKSSTLLSLLSSSLSSYVELSSYSFVSLSLSS